MEKVRENPTSIPIKGDLRNFWLRMPVVAPRGTLDPAIRYVAQFQWDNSVRHETWIRVLLVEGLFDLEEVQSFLDQHFELRDQPIQNVSPASHFSGAVVATMLIFGPASMRKSFTQSCTSHKPFQVMRSHLYTIGQSYGIF